MNSHHVPLAASEATFSRLQLSRIGVPMATGSSLVHGLLHTLHLRRLHIAGRDAIDLGRSKERGLPYEEIQSLLDGNAGAGTFFFMVASPSRRRSAGAMPTPLERHLAFFDAIVSANP